jgi:hypothetical protein
LIYIREPYLRARAEQKYIPLFPEPFQTFSIFDAKRSILCSWVNPHRALGLEGAVISQKKVA